MYHPEPRKLCDLEDELPVATEGGVFEGLYNRHVRVFHVGVLAHKYN